MSTAAPPKETPLQAAARIAGGQSALAAICGYEDRRSVWPWFNTDRLVPVDKCPPIEKATGVTVESLRPDLNWVRVKDREWPLGKPLLDVAAVA